MKKIIAVMIALSFQILAFADCGGAKNSEKTYVSMQNLHFTDDGMFVLLDDVWQQISALYSDEDGFYIAGQPNPEVWYCSKCRTYHSCQENCPRGKSRPSKCDD